MSLISDLLSIATLKNTMIIMFEKTSDRGAPKAHIKKHIVHHV